MSHKEAQPGISHWSHHEGEYQFIFKRCSKCGQPDVAGKQICSKCQAEAASPVSLPVVHDHSAAAIESATETAADSLNSFVIGLLCAAK